jgi:hypothetical protein
MFISISNEHIVDKTMVKVRGLNIFLYKGVSPVANLLTLFIILTSSNECMAYFVLFTRVSIIFIVTNPLLCYRI